MKLSLKEIILSGIFAALTAICAQISIPIPFSPVPITLSIFAVFLSAMVLGTKCGTLSQVIYILLGAVGVPVFAKFSGGLGILVGPTGGYILSYIIMALIMGIIIDRKDKVSTLDMAGTMLIGLVICYSIGTTWLGVSTGMGARKAIAAGVIPFLPLDILKIIIASVIGYRVRASLLKAGLL